MAFSHFLRPSSLIHCLCPIPPRSLITTPKANGSRYSLCPRRRNRYPPLRRRKPPREPQRRKFRPRHPPELGQLILVRNDGQVLLAVAFTVRDCQLTYLTNQGTRRSFPVSELHKDATRQINDATGTAVSL